MEYNMTIIGQVPAKANSFRIIKKGAHYSIDKTQVMKDYENSFYLQCKYRNQDIKGFFKIYIDVFFRSLASDIDNAAKGVLDCLQQCKVIHNDNKCVELHMRKFKDASNPRVEIKIEEVVLT